ncbi:MAG: AAA family ATPase [Selenomonas sp.]|nr:AAA family ATPase [Selenomonas sp.]
MTIPILTKLQAWKNSPVRKPLILKGVRQVGKTWLLKEFGRTEYEHTAYFNFDENPKYAEFFANTKDVRRIIPNLVMASGQTIMPGNNATHKTKNTAVSRINREAAVFISALI